jgi:hypothetical protein
VLELEDAVAVILVLWDTAVVMLGLADRLKLELVVREAEGELVITGPAPTATNAMFADCIQLVTVAGSVSPTV